MQLTLLIPELIWPEPEDRTTLDALACPALHTLLARSRRSQRPAQSLEATLSDFFGHPAGAPYAAFRLLGETANAPDAGDACWINADPVHLRFHQERLILADSGRFALEYAEAQALADELNRHLADTGHFHVAAAGRWYLQLADRQLAGDFDAPPLSAVSDLLMVNSGVAVGVSTQGVVAQGVPLAVALLGMRVTPAGIGLATANVTVRSMLPFAAISWLHSTWFPFNTPPLPALTKLVLAGTMSTIATSSALALEVLATVMA